LERTIYTARVTACGFLQRIYWLFPVAACLSVFGLGATSWFQQDDFAHLLLAAATPANELAGHLIKPFAQGTFRPLSERLFYWLTYHWFGLDSLPPRIFCFVLQTANCGLLALLLFRLTQSRAAAALAASAWAVQPVLTLPLTWIATTNQVMWSFCVLAAVNLFACYTRTHARRYLLGAWLLYLAGFGVLESNVVVPALFTMYALLSDRQTDRQTDRPFQF
jgi:hypothetical protein